MCNQLEDQWKEARHMTKIYKWNKNRKEELRQKEAKGDVCVTERKS